MLATGFVLGLVGWSPLRAIVATQAANDLLLPLIAAFVLYLTLRQDVVSLPIWYHVLGSAVVLLCGGPRPADAVVGRAASLSAV